MNASYLTSISSYGYLNSGGNTGTSGSSGTVGFSAKFLHRIVVGGKVDVLSDYRKKENIHHLEMDECTRFVCQVSPVSFRYKQGASIHSGEHNLYQNDQINYGYIAQDVYKAGFTNLVHVCHDDDGFVNPKDASFTVSTNNIIPILHQCIKDLYAKIERLEKASNVLDNNVPVEAKCEYETITVRGKRIRVKTQN